MFQPSQTFLMSIGTDERQSRSPMGMNPIGCWSAVSFSTANRESYGDVDLRYGLIIETVNVGRSEAS